MTDPFTLLRAWVDRRTWGSRVSDDRIRAIATEAIEWPTLEGTCDVIGEELYDIALCDHSPRSYADLLALGKAMRDSIDPRSPKSGERGGS